MSFSDAQDKFDDANHYIREQDIDNNIRSEKLLFYEGLICLAKGFEEIKVLLQSINGHTAK